MCRPEDFPPYAEPVPAAPRQPLWLEKRCQPAPEEPGWCIVHEAVYEPFGATHCLPVMRELESPDLVSRIARMLELETTPGTFRDLDPAEAERFRAWAREHHAPGQPTNPLWHPIIRAECIVIDREGNAP